MRRTSSKIAIIAGVALCLAGCGHGHGGDTHSGHETDPAAQSGHEADHESHDSGLQLTLNDGEKWPVDQPTRESATRLASLVAGTETIQSVEDARALGDALDAELDILVRGCKMTGPAHDQLHVFLVALFPQVEALQKETGVEDLQMARTEVGELLAAYETHFE